MNPKKKRRHARAHTCTTPGCGRITLNAKCDRRARARSTGRYPPSRKVKLKTLKPSVPTLGATLPQLVPGSWRSSEQNANDRGYTYRWKKARAAWLREHPLCGDREDGPNSEHSQCVRDGRVTAARFVDHIKAHRGDRTLFWQRSNWQSLCTDCNAVKTAQEENERRSGCG